MAEQRQGATYFTFKGGLNTESSYLNAPPEDAADIVNVDITDAGTVRRRHGVDFIPSLDAGSQFISDTVDYTQAANTYVDPAPAQISMRVVKTDGTSFSVLVSHVGRFIYIHNQDNLSTLDSMSDYRQRLALPADAVSDLRAHHTKSVLIKDANRLYVCNQYLPLTYIYYQEDGDTFVLETESVRIRNLDDGIDTDDQVTHNDNTYRCVLEHEAVAAYEPGVGDEWQDVWVLEGKAPVTGAPSAWAAGAGSVVYIIEDDGGAHEAGGTRVATAVYYRCLTSHVSDTGNKPPNSTYWSRIAERSTSLGFSGVSDFLYGLGISFGEATEWVSGRSYTGATQVYKSNIYRLTDASGNGRTPGFSCGVLASGRLWLANPTGEPNTIYFSQSVLEDFHYNRFYQWADPNNPDDPDIVETDGGKIKLINAEEIVGLADYKGGILVLATNGLWYITGSDGYFKADTYSIQRISDEGCVGRTAWTYVEDKIIYAAAGGIFAITLDQVSALPTVVEISQKIKSFWAEIPRYLRQAVEMVYDNDSSRLVMGLNFTEPDWWEERNLYRQATRHRDFLLFDTKLGAWYKYQMSDDDGSKLSPCSLYPVVAQVEGTIDVTVGGEVVTVSAEAVEVASNNPAKQTEILLISMLKDGTGFDWTLSRLAGTAYQDYSLNDTHKESYEGWIQSVPQLFNDVGHRKQVAYLHTLFERVETGFDLSTDSFLNPGGCYYRILWDWASSANANTKYGDAYQAYKPNRFNLTYEDGEIIGFDVVRNKHRVRGSGRSVSFRFETEGDKDFHLLGWQSDIYASAKV